MPAISITDLNNAKLDVDHLAAVATSTALTATDRLGNSKPTMKGIVDGLNAQAAITETAENRALAQAAAATAVAAKDIILVSQNSGTVGFPTFADMTLAFSDKTVAIVINDPDPAKNTWYVKSGVSGAGSWISGTAILLATLTSTSLTIGGVTMNTQTITGYLRTVVDSYGRLAEGTKTDGTQYIDKALCRTLSADAATIAAATISSLVMGAITANVQSFTAKQRANVDNYGRMASWLQDDGSVGIAKLRDGTGSLVYPQITAAKATADAALAAATGVSAAKQAVLAALQKGFYPRAWTSGNPTITVGGAGAGTTIASGTTHSPSSGKFRYLFGNAAVAGASFPDNQCFVWTSAFYGGTFFSANGAAFEFDHTGQILESRFYGKGGGIACRLLVDLNDGTGFRNAGDFSVPNSTGSEYFVRVDFGSSAARRVRFETSNNYFAGLRVSTGDVINAPSDAAPPRFVMLGDSFIEGSGSAYASGGLGLVMGRALGLDLWASGVGSTAVTNAGGLNPFGQQKVNYQGRLTTDVVNVPNLSGLIICQSLNDSTDTQASQLAGLENIILPTRAAKGNIPIVVIGPAWPNSGVPQNLYRIRDAGAQAAAEFTRTYFIDQINPSQIVGSGNSGTPSGSGNADLYTNPDNTHPTQAGHDFRGLYLARELRKALLSEIY